MSGGGVEGMGFPDEKVFVVENGELISGRLQGFLPMKCNILISHQTILHEQL